MPPSRRDNPNRHEFFREWLLTGEPLAVRNFTSTQLTEDRALRDAIKKQLTETVFIHHQDPETYRKKLARLGYPEAAKAIDRRPKPLKTRLANFGEVLASEILRQIKGYEVPVYRLRYNGND